MGRWVMAGALSDADLVRAAQSGEVECLGLLLARHEAGMRAVALAICGYGGDADDAVQDAAVIALRRIGDVRDPGAAGSWLRAIVRNACRAQLRARRTVPVDDLDALGLASREPDPDELVNRHALRDWVWHALERLSPSVRLVAMLRYFTGVTAYEQIAALCAVPVGTVRSRLSQARATLAQALRDSADVAHGDAAALTEARWREGEETLRAARCGAFGAVLAALWSPRIETTWPDGRRTTGCDYMVRAMAADLDAGVRQRLVNVVASREVTIWEADLVNPPDDPFHCPPAVVWVQSVEAGRVRRLRLYHPQIHRTSST